jgi:hypothetical protein
MFLIRHLTSVPQYNKLTNTGLIVKGEVVTSSISALSSQIPVRNPSNAGYRIGFELFIPMFTEPPQDQLKVTEKILELIS